MTKVAAHARHKQSREAALEEMSLQMSVKSRQSWVQTLRAAADRSTRVRRRQEKLCRRWLTDAYGGRPVMKMALNEGDVVG